MAASATAASYPTPSIAANARYLTDFGARCDGSTDAAAAIQAGLNAVRNGGQLVFPADRIRLIGKSLKQKNGRNWQKFGQNATLMMKRRTSGPSGEAPAGVGAGAGIGAWSRGITERDGGESRGPRRAMRA